MYVCVCVCKRIHLEYTKSSTRYYEVESLVANLFALYMHTHFVYIFIRKHMQAIDTSSLCYFSSALLWFPSSLLQSHV